MKAKVNLNSMHYTQFIDYLKSKGIEYMEETAVDTDFWMCSFIEVSPIQSKIKSRFFRRDGGDQLK